MGWEVDLIALIILIATVIWSFAKMQKTVEANKELQEAKMIHITDTVTTLKEDFKDMLTELKEDLKNVIEISHEAENEALETTKEELKEDISRLEQKQAESNCIKERLAKQEVYVDHLLDIHDIKQMNH